MFVVGQRVGRILALSAVATFFFALPALAQTATLSGGVFGGGTPLSNATVEALTNGTTTAVAQSTTDGSGHYALAVQPGTYDLRVTPPAGSGFGQEIVQDVEVTSDRQYDVILLSSGVTGVSGTVRGLGGEPINGVNVYAYSSDSGQFLMNTTTDAGGHYSLALSGGSIRLDFSSGAVSTIAPRSWTYRRYNVSVTGSTTFDLDLPVVVVSGRTVDSNGNGVAGADITANTNSYDPATQTQVFVTGTATSDADGAYRLLMFAGTVGFTIRPPASSNLSVLSVPNVTLTGDASRDFVLPEPLFVRGTVRGLGSQPIAGVNVYAYTSDTGQFLTNATTDASGHYSLALSAGSIRLDFSSNGAASTIAPASWTYRRYNVSVNASTTFDLDLPVVVVSGRTIDSSNNAVAAVAITANSNSYDGATQTQVFVTSNATSDAAGAYRLLMLAGTVSFTIRPPASSNLSVLSVANVSVTSDVSRDFVFPQPTSVSGTVRGVGGQPIAGVNVYAYSSDTGQFLTNATTDTTGHYSLAISAGSIRLDFSYNTAASTIAPRSWTYRRYNVTVAGNTTIDFDVPVVRLAGTAIDSNGAPVPNVRVQGTQSYYDPATQTQWFLNESAVSDAAGSYALLLVRGSAQLQVYPPNGSGFAPVSLGNMSFTGNVTQRIVLQRPDTTAPVIVTKPVVVHLSDTSVSVGWTTDEPATSIVEFWLGALTTTLSSNTLSTSHSVTLQDLNPTAIYTYQVSSVDRSGNGPVKSDIAFFKTQAPPGDITPPIILAGPSVAGVSDRSAIVQWKTDEPATSAVEFGTDTGFGSLAEDVVGSFTSSHSLVLSPLAPSTTYYARVHSVDPDGNAVTSSTITFTTVAEPDVQPPVIQSLSAVAVTDHSITLEWTTNEAATSAVSANDGTAFFIADDPALVTSHRITLTGLAALRTYSIIVSSKDAAGNGPTLAGPISVATLAAPDTTPPVNDVLSVDAAKRSAKLTWATNEPASVEVRYGPVADNPDGLVADLSLVTAHTVMLTGLTPSTQYFGSIVVTDAAGNATQRDLQFTTLAGDALVPPTPPSPLTVSKTPNATGTFVITWGASSDDGPGGVKSYEVFRDGNSIAVLAADATSYAESDLAEGDYTYQVRASDYDDLTSDSSALRVVVDRTAPALEVPATIDVPVTTNTDALVSYHVSATDDRDAAPVVSCAPASGTAFVIGETTVTCTATDAAGNTATGTFKVIVRDPFPPVLTVPAAIRVDATTSTGAAVSYSATAVDNADPNPVVSCEPASGAVFPLGITTVVCTAKDNANNTATQSFTVTVVAPPKAATATNVSVAPQAPAYAEQVTLTAGVVSSAGGLTGSVEFFDGTTLLGRATIGGTPLVATLVTSSLSVGSHSISARYLGDAGHDASVSDAIALTVSKAKPTVAATAGAFGYDGQPHAASGTARGINGEDLGPVTFTYNGEPDAPVNAGTYAVAATFDGNENYEAATATATLVIAKAQPTLAWQDVYSPDYGVPLGSDQLKATANVDGGFTYDPPAGTILGAGDHTLTATFTPADTTNYEGGTVSATVTIRKAHASLIVTGGTFTYDGLPHAADVHLKGVLGEDLSALVTVTYGGSPDVPVDAGTYPVAASFAANADYEAASDTSASIVIEPATTTASLAVSTANPVFGQPVLWTVTVAPPAGSAITAAGTVNLIVDGVRAAPASIVSGAAQIRMIAGTDLSLGAHAVTAEYRGTANFVGSRSAPVGIAVDPASTSTSLIAAPSSAVFGQPVMLTAAATVLAPGAGVPGGAIEFADGGVVIGTADLDASGRASLADIRLAVGAHSLSARYLGAAPFTTSASAPLAFPVDPAATTTALTASSSTVGVLQPLVLTARVDVQAPGEGVPAGSVQFLDGTSVIGTVPLSISGGIATASLSTSSLASGQHTLTATYLGDARFVASTSPAAVVTVNSLAQSTTTSVTLPSSALVNTAVTIEAVVRASAGSAQPTGSVQFYDGATLVGTAPLALARGAMRAAVTVTFAAIGAHQIVATYVPNGTMAPSTSVPMSITIYATPADAPRATTTQLMVPPLARAGTPVTMTATVTVSSGPKTTPTGTVDFYIDGVFTGRGTLSSGTASFTTSSLVRGLHRIVAVYSGAPGLAGSTSTEALLTIW